jgi:thiamine-phosphate pyrophosphorylase
LVLPTENSTFCKSGFYFLTRYAKITHWVSMTRPTKETLRIIDANLNRMGEGLRFLEDIARLMLNDSSLTQQFKDIRHAILETNLNVNTQLVQSRDSEADVGINIEAPEQKQARDLPAAVIANSRRVQESLRTIEELAKLPENPLKLDSNKFKQSRFKVYTLEQQLLLKLLRRDKLIKLHGLYVVIDTDTLKGRSPVEVTKQVLNGGVKVIQLRDKSSDKKTLLDIALRLKTLCSGHEALFIVNDYLDIALASNADGLHMGLNDLPIGVVRGLLPVDKILGASANTVEEALAHQAAGADYIGAGCIFPTESKQDVIIVGCARIREMKKAVNLPLVAIGGINEKNIEEVVKSGADSVAVISAVLKAASPEAATRFLIKKMEVEK